MVRQGLHNLIQWTAGILGVQEQSLNALRSKQPREVAHALERLRALGSLRGGSLAGVVLAGAQLERHDLSDSVLPEVDFYKANLSQCDFSRAQLRGANFTCVDLRGANLKQADLKNAYLWGADLRGANLWGADLRGAFLDKRDYARAAHGIAAAQNSGTLDIQAEERLPTDWEDAFPTGTLFDEQTILPDGSLWSKDSVLRDFTVPEFTDSGHETSIRA